MDLQTYALVKNKALTDLPNVVEDWLEENVDPETGYVLDTTLSMSNAAAPANLVGELKTASDAVVSLNKSVQIPFTSGGTGHYLKYADGTVGSESTATWGWTDYVDVSQYISIKYKRGKSTISNPAVGMAFYNSNKTYITGIQNAKNQSSAGYASELYKTDVPSNAVYARFSYYVDTTTYGDFAIYGESKIVEAVDTISNSTSKLIGGWVLGKYITTSGNVGSTVSMTPGSDATGAYVIVDCSAGDLFTISGCGGQAFRLWCFVDSNNKIIDNAGIRAKLDGGILAAPKNSSKLILNQHLGTDNPSVSDCYFGVYPKKQTFSVLSETHPATISPVWEVGGVEGTGLVVMNDNIRTMRSFGFNQGERLSVTNTSDSLQFTLYSVRNNTLSILSNGWIKSYGRIIVDDWRSTYFVRVKAINAGSADISWGNSIKVEIINDSPDLISAATAKAKDRIGFSRTYSYLNPLLTFERKDLNNDGTTSASTTRCIAVLPNEGNVEVKQQTYMGAFKIAKVSGSTVTYLVDDWSYYSYRYVGDGESTYYVIIAQSDTPSSSITTAQAAHYIAVYLFTDVGTDVKEYWLLNDKKIAFIGDSVTQGRFAKYGTTLNWTTSKPFGELVAEAVGDDNYGNFGIGGALVYNNDWKSLYANCGKVSGYDVVFVCGGTNDYGNNVSQDNFTAAYTYVIETLMSNNTEVVVCTPVYRTSKTGTNTQGLYLWDYCDIEKSIAATKNIKVIDQYTLTNNNKFVSYLPDGLHPNEKGHRIMADNILREYNRLSK